MYRIQGFRRMLPWLVHIGPPAFRRWVMSAFPNPNVRKVQKLVDIMYDKAKGIFKMKKAALEQGDEALLTSVGEGKDIMSILRKLLLYHRSERILICPPYS